MNQPVKLLLDECLGPSLVDDLSRLLSWDCPRPVIHHLFKYFKAGSADDVWIPQIANDGWIILTGDRGKKSGKVKLPAICVTYKITHILMGTSVLHLKQIDILFSVVQRRCVQMLGPGIDCTLICAGVWWMALIVGWSAGRLRICNEFERSADKRRIVVSVALGLIIVVVVGTQHFNIELNTITGSMADLRSSTIDDVASCILVAVIEEFWPAFGLAFIVSVIRKPPEPGSARIESVINLTFVLLICGLTAFYAERQWLLIIWGPIAL